MKSNGCNNKTMIAKIVLVMVFHCLLGIASAASENRNLIKNIKPAEIGDKDPSLSYSSFWDRFVVKETYKESRFVRNSKIPQDIDGKTLDTKKKAIGKIRIVSFKLVHSIPSEKYSEILIFNNEGKNRYISSTINDRGKPKQATGKFSIGLTDNSVHDDLLQLLLVTGFFDIQEDQLSNSTKPDKTITSISVKYFRNGIIHNRKLFVYDLDNKLANTPKDEFFKMKFIHLYVENKGFARK